MSSSPTENAKARLVRDKRIADRDFRLANRFPRLETMHVDCAIFLLEIMRCTTDRRYRMSIPRRKYYVSEIVPLKYRSAARLCRFIARSLASSCSTLCRTASAYRFSLNAFFCSA